MTEKELELLHRKDNESVEEYTDRVCKLKQDLRLSWDDLRDIINRETGESYSESHYRKGFKKRQEELELQSFLYGGGKPLEDYQSNGLTDEMIEQQSSEIVNKNHGGWEELSAIKKERMKLSEYRIQTNADLRRVAREETIKEIAHDFAQTMNSKKVLDAPSFRFVDDDSDSPAAILTLSDWHYGIVVDNYWNKYDPDIAVERINKLRDEVINRCKINNVSELNIVNLSDLICGRIHLPLRLQSRFDVITQIMEVSEILAEFISDITRYGLAVNYYDCEDNHSRIEPNKNDALEIETLTRITKWFLKERLNRNPLVHIYDNDFGDDIVVFNCKGYEIAGVHGDKDSPHKVVENLSLMTRKKFDLILTAHFHHFSCDERNETVVVSNGSLMGTDEYARKLRLSARPSQNLIIVTENSVVDTICRILL